MAAPGGTASQPLTSVDEEGPNSRQPPRAKTRTIGMMRAIDERRTSMVEPPGNGPSDRRRGAGRRADEAAALRHGGGVYLMRSGARPRGAFRRSVRTSPQSGDQQQRAQP